MERVIVGVVRGGPSEHETSLATGRAMLAHLPEDRFLARDLYIDPQGAWHERGRPLPAARALRGLDVALIATHSADGSIQEILEQCGVPYQGSDPFSSLHAAHQIFAKKRAEETGLSAPSYAVLSADADPEPFAVNVVRTFHQPVLVAPIPEIGFENRIVAGGYAPLFQALVALRSRGFESIAVEEVPRGREVTIGIIEGMRGQDLYTLPVIEKIDHGARIRVPAPVPRARAAELVRAGKRMHKALGLRDYSSSDFVLTPKDIYYLRTNPLPPLGPHGLMSYGAESVGIMLPELCAHLVTRALER